MKNIQSLTWEQNPIARVLMKKLGINQTIWLIFFIEVIVVTLSQISIINASNPILCIGYN